MNLFKNLMAQMKSVAQTAKSAVSQAASLRTVLALLTILASLALASPARAQANVDFWGAPRYFQLLSPTIFTNASGSNVYSGPVVDIHGCEGNGVILTTLACGVSNNPAALVYPYIIGSMNGSNWWTLTNTATSSSATYNLTNGSYGFTATNTYLLPGTVTTPVSGTAGFANPNGVLAPNLFTNSCTNYLSTTGGMNLLGFVAADQPRYLQFVLVINGTGSYVASAAVIARKQSGAFYY